MKPSIVLDPDGMFRASLELLFKACGDLPTEQQTQKLDEAFEALPEAEFLVLDEATTYLEAEMDREPCIPALILDEIWYGFEDRKTNLIEAAEITARTISETFGMATLNAMLSRGVLREVSESFRDRGCETLASAYASLDLNS